LIFAPKSYSQKTWKTFNHKNGFSIQLPDNFKEDILVAILKLFNIMIAIAIVPRHSVLKLSAKAALLSVIYPLKAT